MSAQDPFDIFTDVQSVQKKAPEPEKSKVPSGDDWVDVIVSAMTFEKKDEKAGSIKLEGRIPASETPGSKSKPETPAPKGAELPETPSKPKAPVSEDDLQIVVVAVDENKQSLNALQWVIDDPIGFVTKDLILYLAHVAKNDEDRPKGFEILKEYEAELKRAAPDRFIIKTKLLLTDETGPAHAFKVWINELKPKLVVLGAGQKGFFERHVLGSFSDFVQHHVQAPVMIVKKDRRGYVNHRKAKHVAIAVDSNVHSDHAVSWFLKEADLPKDSLMVLLHAVGDVADKPQARNFLNSFKPQCMESKKDWNMKSGLVFFKALKPQEAMLKYAKDYEVDLLVIASRGLFQFARQLHGSYTDYAVHNHDGDVLVYRDWRTRLVGPDPRVSAGAGAYRAEAL